MSEPSREQVCGTCGNPDRFPEDPKSELAPYGPGGAPICARCAFGTPEAEAEVKARWMAVADAHDAIGAPIVITDSATREVES